MTDSIEAFVLGRLLADIYPQQIKTPLEDVRTFERFVGGFAGNVGIGLARLGVRTAVLSGVGDDGHGRFLMKTLQREGVETRWIRVDPVLRTALAFCEMWPPDHFPFTAYRFPTCPDWELQEADLPHDEISEAPLLFISGTALAKEPSRTATYSALECRLTRRPRHVATVVDLDWREAYWERPSEFPLHVRMALRMADTVIGGDSEFEAANLKPEEVRTLGPERVFVKHGPRGASLILSEQRFEVEPIDMPVVNGLGAGDAFAAAVGQGLLADVPPPELLAAANAAGAIVATRISCSAAMPFKQELTHFLESGRLADPEERRSGEG
jgi:5-dehydro-2-deoxygluconokinase